MSKNELKEIALQWAALSSLALFYIVVLSHVG
jgi:hypothetical protein